MNLVAFPLSLTLAYTGMLLFCLGMERHWKHIASPRVPAKLRRVCAPLGTLMLALTVYTCSFIWQPGMAWVGWFGMISLGGLALLMLLPYAPRLVLWLPVAGGLTCGLLSLA